MKYTVVLPSIYEPWTEKCIASMHPEFRMNLLLVDNTEDNKGVAASWNLGIDRMIEDKSDWLIIVSASVRFGDSGGLDAVQALEQRTGHDVVAVEADLGIGWHLIAFPARTIAATGRFDENFYPAYNEDLDYAHRISLAFGGLQPPYWEKVIFDVMHGGFAHGVNLGKVKTDPNASREYLKNKWGSYTGPFPYKTPFNVENTSIKFWPRGAHTRSRYSD